jgi:hypothetical protein
MMPDLASIYDEAFFKEWGRHNLPYIESARTISRMLYEELRPGSLVDLGAGCGVYSDEFRALGVRVLSIDGVLPPPSESFEMDFVKLDLTDPFENRWGPFDAALCLEVAEHIPEELIDPFLGNITQFSDLLVLSCAPPKQEGKHHVSLRPKRYWKDRLAGHGFEYDRRKTGVLLERFKGRRPRIELAWMYQQVSIYRAARGA